MKPASAKVLTDKDGIEYYLYRDKAGASRRARKRVCDSCGKVEWLLKGKIKPTCFHCVLKRGPSEDARIKISNTLREKYTSPSYKTLVASLQNRKSGEDHWNWKGGITPENQKQRTSEKYSLWRNSVFKRDKFHCRLCFINSDALHAHHILPWSSFPEERFNINNGMTLCKECHSKIHFYLKEVEYQTTKCES